MRSFPKFHLPIVSKTIIAAPRLCALLLSTYRSKILDDLVNDVFPSTVKFVSTECQAALLTDVGSVTAAGNQVTPGVSEVSAFLRILSAMLDRSLNREEIEKKLRMEEEGFYLTFCTCHFV